MEKNNQNNQKPEFPGRSEKDGIKDSEQAVREPMAQSHENRERPREDHPTGHLGYNSTHLDSNPNPPEEGSDKI